MRKTYIYRDGGKSSSRCFENSGGKKEDKLAAESSGLLGMQKPWGKCDESGIWRGARGCSPLRSGACLECNLSPLEIFQPPTNPSRTRPLKSRGVAHNSRRVRPVNALRDPNGYAFRRVHSTTTFIRYLCISNSTFCVPSIMWNVYAGLLSGEAGSAERYFRSIWLSTIISRVSSVNKMLFPRKKRLDQPAGKCIGEILRRSRS